MVPRLGQLDLRVPRDGAGRCSTERFAREQRSETALVRALTIAGRRAGGATPAAT